MRLGVIADIHGNLPALEACWDYMKELGVDRVVCLGDLVQYGPFPSEVIDFIRDNHVDTVQGNCDRAVARRREDTGDSFQNIHWLQLAGESLEWTEDALDGSQLRYLRKLPPEIRYQLEGRQVLCLHGLPGNVCGSFTDDSPDESCDLLLRRNSCDVLLTGHTHRPILRGRPRGLVINPGSLGGGTLPGEAVLSCLEVDEENGVVSVSWHRVPFDTCRYEEEYRSKGLPEIFLRCILLGRDQRGDWHSERWRMKWAEP